MSVRSIKIAPSHLADRRCTWGPHTPWLIHCSTGRGRRRLSGVLFLIIASKFPKLIATSATWDFMSSVVISSPYRNRSWPGRASSSLYEHDAGIIAASASCVVHNIITGLAMRTVIHTELPHPFSSSSSPHVRWLPSSSFHVPSSLRNTWAKQELVNSPWLAACPTAFLLTGQLAWHAWVPCIKCTNQNCLATTL